MSLEGPSGGLISNNDGLEGLLCEKAVLFSSKKLRLIKKIKTKYFEILTVVIGIFLIKFLEVRR